MKLKRFIFIVIVILLVITAFYLIFKKNETIQPTQTNIDVDPYELALSSISTDRMIAFISELTSVNQSNGWRSSATEGEAMAFDLVDEKVNEFAWLKSQGMVVEREYFNVFIATEEHSASVSLSTLSKTIEIDANTTRGHRDNLEASIRMDSDGSLADQEPDPVSAAGDIIVIKDEAGISALKNTETSGKIAIVNYGIVDTGLQTAEQGMAKAKMILDLEPSAIVLVTSNSNTVSESHGTFVGDGGGGFQYVTGYDTIPLIYMDMEELKPLGITNWQEMETLTSGEVNWDVDVMNPGESQNLILHIPGEMEGKPVLISAHLDSANSPGGLDDGSGSAILMEITNVLNEKHIRPTVDLYLVWFGSEEIGLYGSTYFTTTHSELINDLQANIQIDCLTQPLNGLPAQVMLSFSHINGSDIASDPLSVYLTSQAEEFSIPIYEYYWPFSSDNGSFSAFGVSNLNMLYESEEMNSTYAGVWYAGHMHDPYDTVNLVREEKDALEQMTKLAMSGAFIPLNEQKIRSTEFTKKVVFLANNTEAPQMTPAGFPELSLAFINAGYEVEVLPFGNKLTETEIKDAEIIVVLPPYDYPVDENVSNVYDVSWTEDEAQIINDYAQNGGVVLVVNSAHRLKLYNRPYDDNEDWAELNTLTDQWDIHFIKVGSRTGYTTGKINNQEFKFTMQNENSVPFTAAEEFVLAGTAKEAYLAEVPVENGKVIVLSDMTVMGENDYGLVNEEFVSTLLNLME